MIETAIPAVPQKKGRPVLAWIVIVVLVGLIVWQHNAAPPAGPEAAATEDVDVRIMGCYLVGVNDLSKLVRKDVGQELYKSAKSMDTGPLDRRLRFVVLAGELAGPMEAQAQLAQIDVKG